MSDLRQALRQFIRTPTVTAVAVLSLALGIGATATVVCWMRHLVLDPLPGVAAPESLAVLISSQGSGPVSLPDLLDITAEPGVFAGALASMSTAAALTVDDQQDWVKAEIVSAGAFDVLGVKPILGRTFLPEEDRKPGGNPVLVISERLWRSRFGASPGVVGRVVDLNRHAFTIVGVVPASFLGTEAPSVCDAWAPLSMIWEVRNQGTFFLERRGARGWHNLVRLQPGVTPERASAAAQAAAARLATAYPDTNREVTYRVAALADSPWGASAIVRPMLLLLGTVCVGVLLIVAANVANLLLARATNRQREIAIRLAVGASRRQLVRLLLTESVLLALAGGCVGVLFAGWAIDSIPLFLPSPPTHLALDFPLDGTTLAWTLLLTLTTGIAFGLAPALQASHPNLSAALKEGGRSAGGGRSHHRMRRGLVVAEVALALVLLVGAGLCVKGLARARQLDLGFQPEGVLMAEMRIGMNGYTRETGPAFYRQLRERIAALPGVEEAALASWLPLGLSGCKGTGVRVDGYERPAGEDTNYEYAIVSPRYFAAMRAPLLSGRDFSDGDDATGTAVAIVNEAFARRFWPGLDPLGRTFRANGRDRTIVGVVKTGRYNRLNEDPRCFFYLPYQQGVPDLDLGLCVRTGGDPAAFSSALLQAVREVDPGVGLLNVKPLTAHIGGSFFTQRMASKLLTMLGIVALVLAAMGVYAVMAYAVSQRTQEFGLRMALGATAGQVLGHVIGQGLALAALGAGAGLGLAIAVSRLLGSFLHGVSPFDPVIFLAVPAVLALVVALACWMPARRATRVNPIEALRSE